MTNADPCHVVRTDPTAYAENSKRVSARTAHARELEIQNERYSTSLPQYLHLVAATGRSAERHFGHVFTGAAGFGPEKTSLPVLRM